MFLQSFIIICIPLLWSTVLCVEQFYTATHAEQVLPVNGYTNGITDKITITITAMTLNVGDYLQVYFSEFSVSDDFPSCKTSSVKVKVKVSTQEG